MLFSAFRCQQVHPKHALSIRKSSTSLSASANQLCKGNLEKLTTKHNIPGTAHCAEFETYISEIALCAKCAEEITSVGGVTNRNVMSAAMEEGVGNANTSGLSIPH